MLFGFVTYKPSHPFGKANIMVKEQWRMQWSQSFDVLENEWVAKDANLAAENVAKLVWVAW